MSETLNGWYGERDPERVLTPAEEARRCPFCGEIPVPAVKSCPAFDALIAAAAR